MISGLPAFANDDHTLLLVAEKRGPAGVKGVDEGGRRCTCAMPRSAVRAACGKWGTRRGAQSVQCSFNRPRERVAH